MDEWLDFTEIVDKVQELFDLGLYEEGIEMLEQYNKLYAGEIEFHLLYARAYSEQDDSERALESLKTAYKIDKNNQDCLLGLFYTYAELNQLSRAFRFLLRARRLYPDNDMVLNALIWYFTQVNAFNEAITVYESSKHILDHNAEALRNVAIAYERLGNMEDALLCFRTSFELNPDLEGSRDLLADHYILRGESDRAIELYKSQLQLSPNNIKAMSRLVYCYSQNEQVAEAETAARTIIKTYPNSPVGYVDLAYVFLNSNKVESALEFANKALDVSPIDAEAYRVKGIAYSEQKEFIQAELSFKKALSLFPDNPEFLRDYYHHLRTSLKFKKMEKIVQKVIKEQYPYCIEDYWFLADYYRENNQNLLAFHYLAKAYKLMPSEKDLIPSMAEILLEMGHIAFAIPILKNYIDTKGWDEIMEQLRTHKKLQGKWHQEGMRFLQYYGQKPTEFRRYVFTVYLRKAINISLYLVLSTVLLLSFVYFNIKGVVLLLLVYLLAALSIRGLLYFVKKHKLTIP